MDDRLKSRESNASTSVTVLRMRLEAEAAEAERSQERMEAVLAVSNSLMAEISPRQGGGKVEGETRGPSVSQGLKQGPVIAGRDALKHGPVTRREMGRPLESPMMRREASRSRDGRSKSSELRIASPVDKTLDRPENLTLLLPKKVQFDGVPDTASPSIPSAAEPPSSKTPLTSTSRSRSRSPKASPVPVGITSLFTSTEKKEVDPNVFTVTDSPFNRLNLRRQATGQGPKVLVMDGQFMPSDHTPQHPSPKPAFSFFRKRGAPSPAPTDTRSDEPEPTHVSEVDEEEAFADIAGGHLSAGYSSVNEPVNFWAPVPENMPKRVVGKVTVVDVLTTPTEGVEADDWIIEDPPSGASPLEASSRSATPDSRRSPERVRRGPKRKHIPTEKVEMLSAWASSIEPTPPEALSPWEADPGVPQRARSRSRSRSIRGGRESEEMEEDEEVRDPRWTQVSGAGTEDPTVAEWRAMAKDRHLLEPSKRQASPHFVDSGVEASPVRSPSLRNLMQNETLPVKPFGKKNLTKAG
ncbi:hypothetical protein HDU67_003789, partial [Dinochytrium kinnereticum]